MITVYYQQNGSFTISRMAAQGEGISDSGVVAIVSNTMIMDVCADYAHSEE